MNQFYAQLNDGSSMKKTADRIEIVNKSVRVYIECETKLCSV